MTATKITQTGYSQGFRQFFKVVDWHISESTGRIFFLCCKAPFGCWRWELPGGGGLGACSPPKIEHSEMLFPAFLEPKSQFSRQGWSSLKFWEMMSYKYYYYKANQHLNLTFIVPRHFSKTWKIHILWGAFCLSVMRWRSPNSKDLDPMGVFFPEMLFVNSVYFKLQRP